MKMTQNIYSKHLHMIILKTDYIQCMKHHVGGMTDAKSTHLFSSH